MSEQLHYSIQNLHNLLDKNPVDECTAGSLRQMTDELRISVAQAEGKVPEQDYNSKLEEVAVRLSESHPAITQAIREIIITLGSIGI